MSYDRLAEEADWKDGMNAFREKILKEITEIYHSLAEIRNAINIDSNIQKMNLCELCDSEEGIRRKDNIYVCDKCNKEHPIEGDSP